MSEQDLIRVIDRAKSAKGSICVAVVGDVMLDRYVYGSVSRISPEAPIPVLNYAEERVVLGGAGNVVANLCGLGASVTFFARVGDDSEGAAVRRLLADLDGRACGSVEFVPLVKDFTTVKTRIVGDWRQQMLRLDKEICSPLSPEQENLVVLRLREKIGKGLRAVVLSDYGKGICSPSLCRKVISLAQEGGVPVYVDPKGVHWERYSGAELVTPNVKELSDIAGEKLRNADDAAVLGAARAVRERYAIRNLLVTRSEKGCTFLNEEQSFDVPSRAVDVYDVSGAGDTVIAAVVVFRSCGVGWHVCCQLANLAAQIVIAKAGTYAVSLSELRAAAGVLPRRRSYVPPHKTLALSELERVCARWREAGETIVFTNGCFDVLHAGHVDSLQRARGLGDHLIVGLNSDGSVQRLKGDGRPVNNQEFRVRVLEGLDCVDAIIVFDENTPEHILSVLRPNILAKGGDYTPEQVAGARFADSVVILPLVEGLSTTAILERGGARER